MNKETLLMRYNDFEETKYLQEFISEEGRRKGTEALQEELKIDIDSFENVRKGGQEGVFSFDIIAEDSFNQEKIKEAEKIKNILNYWLRLYSVKETDSFYNQVEEFHGVVDEVNTNKDSFNVILFNVKEPEKKFYAEFGFDDIQYKSDRDLVKVGAQLVWIIGKETKLLLRDGYFRLGPQSSISKITFRRTKTLNKKQKQEAEKMQSTGQDFLKNVSRTKLKEAEIEISIFGKGFGECIVLCVGEKDCIIVDSFLNPSTQNPIAIDYLKAIDFDCNRIKFVVLTHWHTDHISGISEILYSANPNVKLVLSPIITKKKFNDFINYAIQEESKSTSEYERVLEFIKQRGASCIKFASHDKRIFATEDSNSNVEIFSLSPQDNDLIRYLRSLVRPDKAGKTAYEFKEDNILSIVLLIKLLDNGILLGSDLETTNKDHEGWDAVVNNYTHLKCHPSIFKVPHHGSENGHNNFVWEKILRQKPISILTAYNKGYKLPKDSDIDRIKKLSEKLYVIGSKSKQDKELKLKIRKLMPDVKIEALPDQIGMVRWRKELNNSEDNGKIDFFGKVYCY